MTDKQIIFNCDVDCIKKNTEECFELECIYGQESILKQLSRKEQECETLASQLDFEVQKKECLEQEYEELKDELIKIRWRIEAQDIELNDKEEQLDQLKADYQQAGEAWEYLCKTKDNQIAELKAENENLKHILQTEFITVRATGKEPVLLYKGYELDKLIKENKHLNDLLNQALKELEELQNLKDEDSLRVVILARENKQLKNRINNFVCSENCYKYKEAQSYKQALEKVRELCQKDKDFCVSCEGDGHIDCIDCTEGGKAKLAVQILQIFDEVKDV